jgi:hypothetical protein
LLAKYFRAVEFAQWSQLLQELPLADPKKLDLLAEQVAGWRRDSKPTDDRSDLVF